MKTINRRRFLTSTMAAIGLPYLESFSKNENSTKEAKTFVAIGSFFGWHREDLYPSQVGKNYALPKLIEPMRRTETILPSSLGLIIKLTWSRKLAQFSLRNCWRLFARPNDCRQDRAEKSFSLYSTRRWRSGRPGRYDELHQNRKSLCP